MQKIRKFWREFEQKYPRIARFAVFSLVSFGVTLLQLILMPLLKAAFSSASLTQIPVRLLRVGTNADGSAAYLFDCAAGALPAGGGGLAYFLAVQITLLLAQVANFFGQRRITFNSDGNVWVAAFWYLTAYVLISVGAAALQRLYKAGVYRLLMETWGLGASGETLADWVTMLINCTISFFVYYPIFHLIFKRKA